MPAKSRKKPAARSTRTAKKNVSPLQNIVTRLKTKQGLIIIVVIALIGAFMVFRSSAATTNFEAENGTRNNLVTVGSDTSASNGRFTAFARPTTTTTNNTQRFPGDPNPLVTGKSYWGGNVFALLADGSKTNDVRARHEVPTGKPYPIYHTYHNWGDIDNGSMVSRARADHTAGRLPYLTFKTVDDWSAVGRGQHDAQLDKLIRELDALGRPVWIGAWHEPENDTNGTTRTPATWRAMQIRFKQRMDAANNGQGTKNIAFMPHFMAYTFSPGSGRNPDSWWADNTWDAIMISNYCNAKCIESGGSSLTTNERANAVRYIEGKGMPWGLGEWSLSEKRTGPLRFTATFAEYWNWGFINKKDVIAYNYFDADESRPDPDSPYFASLRDENLEAFHKILRDDQRVMRLADLGRTSSTSTATTNYGTVTANINVPESGTYKLWVRMSAPDTSNNAVQAQIDSGAAVKMGDGGLSANTWTWVDWKGGNTQDKATFVLNAGTRSITLTGIEAGVRVDRVLLTNETCIPTGTGDNCTAVVPPPAPEATVTMTSPANGATVRGSVPVRATSTGAVESVSFRIAKTGEPSVWQATDQTAPYEWAWDTTKVSNGTYDVVTRTRIAGDPGNVYTERSVRVNVANTSAVTNPPIPAPDSQAPYAPTSVRAGLIFDWTRLRYAMNLSWVAATDNNEVAAYQISRNGTQIGTTSTTQFSDATELQAGTTYTYSVTASDAAANRSRPAGISVQTQCNWIFCTATVL